MGGVRPSNPRFCIAHPCAIKHKHDVVVVFAVGEDLPGSLCLQMGATFARPLPVSFQEAEWQFYGYVH